MALTRTVPSSSRRSAKARYFGLKVGDDRAALRLRGRERAGRSDCSRHPLPPRHGHDAVERW